MQSFSSLWLQLQIRNLPLLWAAWFSKASFVQDKFCEVLSGCSLCQSNPLNNCELNVCLFLYVINILKNVKKQNIKLTIMVTTWLSDNRPGNFYGVSLKRYPTVIHQTITSSNESAHMPLSVLRWTRECHGTRAELAGHALSFQLRLEQRMNWWLSDLDSFGTLDCWVPFPCLFPWLCAWPACHATAPSIYRFPISFQSSEVAFWQETLPWTE